MLSVIVPTYNERQNLNPLVERLADILKGRDWEIVVVDDNSPDGTAAEAMELAKEYPVRVIIRQGKLGLGSAIVEGFKSASGNILGVIDADLQHPPEVMADLVLKVEEGSDIAIASRYAAGGGVQGWAFPRRVVSRVATLLSRPLTKVKDPMSGCFCLTRMVVDSVRFAPTGYKILLEILARANHEKVVEVPYTFGKRDHGVSKLGWVEYIRYLKLLFRLYLVRVKVGVSRRWRK